MTVETTPAPAEETEDQIWRAANALDATDETPAPDDPAPDDTPTDQPEQDPAPDTPEANTDPEPEPEPTPDDVDKTRQSLREWQGRERKAKELAAAEERRLAELQRRREELESTGKSPAAQGADPASDTPESSAFALSDEERAAIDAVAEDFPDMHAAFSAMAKQHAAQLLEEQFPKHFEKAAKPIKETVQKSSDAAHYDAIAREHKDWREVGSSPEFQDWLGSVPYADGVRYQQVIKEGSADEVISMLSDFKNTRNDSSTDDPPNTPEPPDPARSTAAKRQRQLANNERVASRRGGPPPAAPDPYDEDQAWRDATAR